MAPKVLVSHLFCRRSQIQFRCFSYVRRLFPPGPQYPTSRPAQNYAYGTPAAPKKPLHMKIPLLYRRRKCGPGVLICPDSQLERIADGVLVQVTPFSRYAFFRAAPNPPPLSLYLPARPVLPYTSPGQVIVTTCMDGMKGRMQVNSPHPLCCWRV